MWNDIAEEFSDREAATPASATGADSHADENNDGTSSGKDAPPQSANDEDVFQKLVNASKDKDMPAMPTEAYCADVLESQMEADAIDDEANRQNNVPPPSLRSVPFLSK